MSRQNDDGYFPSTPIRRSLNSPDKPTYASGSVSSSIASSPRKSGQSVHDVLDDEQAASPAVEQLKKGGFASVRVGLGSPGLMKRTWTGTSTSTRTDDENGRRGSGDRLEGLPEQSLSSRSFVDQHSGLPTPPGTESDIGPPPAIVRNPFPHSPRKVRLSSYMLSHADCPVVPSSIPTSTTKASPSYFLPTSP
jgi:hypothetical protein